MSKAKAEESAAHNLTDPKKVSYASRDGTGLLNSSDDDSSRRPSHLAARRGTVARRSISVARQSYWQIAGDSLLSFRRNRQNTSQVSMPLQYENTFRTQPLPEQRFSVSRVETLMKGMLQGFFCDISYDPMTSGAVARKLSDSLKSRIRDMGYQRYKVVVQLLILQKCPGQSAIAASRCLWYPENGDTFVQTQFTNDTLNVIATAFATYTD